MEPATGLRPLTARSAVLSVLLGAHPPTATVQELVTWGHRLGIAEPALRMAVSRMVAAGDLLRDGRSHTLAPRLVDRQRRQDEAVGQPRAAWDGQWDLAVVTTSGMDAVTRHHLRATLSGARFGRLRDGVWMRPANLGWTPPAGLSDALQMMTAVPAGDGGTLAATLFDLGGWSRRGSYLLGQMGTGAPLDHQVTVAAAIVRHLMSDPLLPSELEPASWPGERLRHRYTEFRDGLVAMHGGDREQAQEAVGRTGS